MSNTYNRGMSKGIGKLQRDILHYMETDRSARQLPTPVMLVAFYVRELIKPGPTYEKFTGIVDPSPEKIAKYHAGMQSVRRALRGLEDRGLAVKFESPIGDDQRESVWMATSAYLESDF